jgi:hypothetical protein
MAVNSCGKAFQSKKPATGTAGLYANRSAPACVEVSNKGRK